MREASKVKFEVGQGPSSARLFVACHGTQLLVIQHLRQHAQLSPAREFLVWCPNEQNNKTEAFMRSVIAGAGFDATLDVRRFESLKPRRHGAGLWWFEAARRLNSDVRTLRRWMSQNRILESETELWAEDPVHFAMAFAMGLLKKARRVKYPHCFNLEDATIMAYRERLLERERSAHWAKRRLFWPWVSAATGCDLRPASSLTFDAAYSFDVPSCWSDEKVDASSLISLEAFAETFAGLSFEVRAELEASIAPIRDGGKPLALLLLFGLDSTSQQAYRDALRRMYRERTEELDGCALAIKLHPGADGREEEQLFNWAFENLPVPVHPIRSVLNVEFMLSELRPRIVLAGPCGALPIVERLRAARVVVIREIRDVFFRRFPTERESFETLIAGMEVW